MSELPDHLSAHLFNIPTNIFPPIFDKYMGTPVLFSLIVLFQGCFGGMGLIKVPDKIVELAKQPLARIIYLLLISYTATSDLEVALFAVCLFLGLMYLAKSDEERKNTPFI